MSDQPAWRPDSPDQASGMAPPYGVYPVVQPPARRGLSTPLVAGLVLLVVAALGIPLGYLWSALAPRLPMVKYQGDLYFIDAGPEELAAADGWFILLALGTGVLLAFAAWFGLRRHRGPLVMAALGVGSLAASWLAAWIGSGIGRAEYDQRLASAPDRTLLTLPLEVGATGDGWFGQLTGIIAIQALIAVFLYMIMAGWSKYPELRAPEPDRYQPAWQPEGQFGPGFTGSSEMGTGTART